MTNVASFLARTNAYYGDNADRIYQKEKFAESRIVFDKTGDKIHKRPPNFDLEPADERGDDLRLTPAQREELFGRSSQSDGQQTVQKRKFVSEARSINLWKDGVMPWKFSDKEQVLDKSKVKVREVITMYETRTCIRLPEIGANEQITVPDYINVVNRSGCWSWLGKMGKEQDISIGNGCLSLGTIAHEFGHALGFYHEQSRSDRDSYINVNTTNISKRYLPNFDKAKSSVNYAPYDEGSVMHYGTHGFSTNGEATIATDDPELNFLLGQRTALTFYDFEALNEAYECNKTCPQRHCQNGGYQNHKCVCECPYGLGGISCENLDTQVVHADCSKIIYLTESEQQTLEIRPFHTRPNWKYNCAYIYVSPPGTTLELQLDKFQLPCSRDLKFQIRYNLPAQPGPTFCGDLGQRTKVFKTSLHKQSQLSIFFEIRNQDQYYIKASVKVISGQQEEQKPEQEENKAVKMDFEAQTIDGFNQNAAAALKWIIYKGPTKSSGTGPDGAYAGNYYAYMESSSPATKGQQAILTSDNWYKANSAICIDLYYHMLGRTLGRLAVRLLDQNGRTHVKWYTSRSYKEWRHLKLDVSEKFRFRIQIVATRGSNYESDIAIDNVFITTAACEKEVVVSFVEDFEKGVKNLINRGDKNWVRKSGSTPTQKTGPSSAHTGEYYVYFETSKPVTQGQTAVYVTRKSYTGSTALCIDFWYYMYGQTMGSLNVAKRLLDGSDDLVYWSRNGDQGQEWKHGLITISKQSQGAPSFRIVFTAIRGNNYLSDIALDDIKVTMDKCKR